METDPYTYHHGNINEGYAVYNIDTDISDMMMFNSINTSSNGKNTSSFLPRDEWDKLTQEPKDRLIAKRRQEIMNQRNGNRKVF